MTAPKRRPLARRERIAWTRLARTPGVGSLTFHRLVAQYKGADGALDALPHISKRRLVPPTADAVEAEIEALEDMGARLIASCEPDYPALLAQIDPCPPLISIRGDAALFTKPLVAIVGAREASAAGQKLAAQFARELGELGFVIVSGMARGIDARVHETTLETGTIAVLAGGLDRPYPPQNLALHDAICARARSSRKRRSAFRPVRGISPVATTSSPASRSAWRSSKPPSVRAPSSPRARRANRGAK